MESVWQDVKMPRFDALRGDVRTDVLIIGGGMAGILCAHMLKEEGIDCVVAEATEIGGGITKNTTAKITAQHGLFCADLIRRFGTEKAWLYLEANEEAVGRFRQMCHDIDCDFSEQDNFIYSEDNYQILEEELIALESIHADAEFAEQLDLPFTTVGAVKLPRQAQFHPMKFLAAIVGNLNIYENTPVLRLTKSGAVTPGGTITAHSVIVTTHFPFLNKHGSYFLKLYQQRSYVLALKNAPAINGMYLNEKENGLSLRCHGDLLILGGGGHRTGKAGGGWQEIAHLAGRYYPQAAEVRRWATQDCMSLDGIPYIGRYSARTSNLYVATGFNKWGMTFSMVAARILTDLITGKSCPYTDVFSPSRSILHLQLGINAWEAISNLLRVTPRRCPHMGCALHWNPQERSWDCACHGSRFREDGKLIDNPATDDLNRRR